MQPWLSQREDASREGASIILLFENVNQKVKSTSKLLGVSRDLTVHSILKLTT